jgi:hypothetical protein
MTKAQEMVIARARQFKFVRETKGNRGRWVEALQRIGGTSTGQPWCACYVCAILGLWFDDKPPIPYTASCDDILNWARANDCLRTEPAPAALFLVMANPNDATHVGFVTEDIAKVRFGTLEGNASDPDKPPTREGWGVFERTTKHPRARKRSPNILYVWWWLPAERSRATTGVNP